MKKYLLISLFAFFTFGGIFALSGTQNCADAKTYGPNDTCPADASKKVSSYYSGSISSMDIHVAILGTNVPSGIKFQISATTQDACTSVKCLLRQESEETEAYTQGAILRKTLDQLGCGGAGSGCNDNATISVAAVGNLQGRTCTWSYSANGAANSFQPNSGSTQLVLANGTETYKYFMYTCTSPIPPACVSLTKDNKAGNGGTSAQGTVQPNQSVNLFANIENDNGTRVSNWSSSCGSYTTKGWEYATWKAPNTPGTCFITYSLNGENQPSCNGYFTIPSPTSSPTPSPSTTPIPTVPAASPNPTTPPVNTLPPTQPPASTNSPVPTITDAVCPAPSVPNVTINCPACSN